MDNIRDVAVDLVVKGGLNPRRRFDSEHIKELAGSIKRDGLWNPIIVRECSDGKYDLIAGECRLRAVKRIGLVNIRARILRIDDEEAKLLALKTNVMRRDLNPVEEGQGIRKLVDIGWSLKKIAKNLNKSLTWVYTRLKLAENGSEGLQNAVLTEQITFTSAVKISELPEGLQGPVVSKAIKERLNSKEIEKLVDLLKMAEQYSDIELLLKKPMEGFFNSAPYGLMSKKHNNGNNGGITSIRCNCGINYIIDWVNGSVVSERVNGQ